MERDKTRPVGHINIHDPRGYGFIPQILRKELGIEGKGKIPFYINANTVLLVRKGAKRADILRGLDILKEDLKLRWKKENQKEPKRQNEKSS